MIVGSLFVTAARAEVDSDCLDAARAGLCDATRSGAIRALDAALEKVIVKRGWDRSCLWTLLYKGDSMRPASVVVTLNGSPNQKCSDLRLKLRAMPETELEALHPELAAALQKLPASARQQLADIGALVLTNGNGTEVTHPLSLVTKKANEAAKEPTPTRR